MAIRSSSVVPLCGAEEGFTDLIGGEGDVEGKAGFKETGESTEGSASVCGRSPVVMSTLSSIVIKI